MSKKPYSPRLLILLFSLFLITCSGKKTTQYYFDIDEDLKVVAATPSGEVDDVAQAKTIVVVFNHAMVPLEELPAGDGSGPLVFSPEIEGKFRWLGTNTLSFTPAKPLELASAFSISIPAGTAALNGKKLKTGYSWTFSTLLPKLVGASIRKDGTKDVELDQSFFLRFNQVIDIKSSVERIYLQKTQPAERIELDLSTPKKTEQYRLYGIIGYPARDDAKSIKCVPKKKLDIESSYELVIEKGIEGVEGNIGSPERVALPFSTFDIFKVEKIAQKSKYTAPDDAFYISFTNRVSKKVLFKNHFRITPAIDLAESYYTSDYSQEEMYVYARLNPRTTYTVTIKKGLKDIHGNTLTADFTQSFTTSDYRPVVNTLTGYQIIEGDLNHYLPVYVLNPPVIDLKMAHLTPSEAQQIIVDGLLWSSSKSFANWDRVRAWQPEVKLNQRKTSVVNLDEVLPSGKLGAVFVELKQEGRDYAQRSLIQVTNLGITAKFSPNQNLITVTELKNARPVAKARVEIRNDNGKVLWTGKTDGSGFAETPGWKKLGISSKDSYREPRQWVFAYRGADMAFSHSDLYSGVEPYDFDIDYRWYQPTGDEISGYAFSNQGIYRPGEEVSIKAVLRKREEDAWKVLSGDRVSVKIQDPDGETVLEKKINLNSYGALDLSYALSASAILGYYYVEVLREADLKSDDEYRNKTTFSFRVEEFRPVEFEVSVRPQKAEQVWGEKLKASIDGHYLFGGAMADAEVNWSITRNASHYQPPGHDGYFFASFDATYSSGLIKSGSGKLSHTGTLAISDDLDAQKRYQTSRLVIEGTVEDLNRQVVSGRAGVLVHAGRYYIGLKPSTTFHQAEKPLDISVATVKPDGSFFPGQKVGIRILKREWHSYREKDAGGYYRWNWVTNDSLWYQTTITTKTVPETIAFTPTRTGYYIITSEGTDDLGNKITSSCYVYVTGSGYTPWAMSADSKIELVSDKPKYRTGETARILVKSPYKRSDAIVTIEREGILSHRRVTLNGNAGTIDIPINETYLPNVFVSVMILTGRTSVPTEVNSEDLGKPDFKIGYINLSVDPVDKKLTVDLNPNRKKYKPGEKVSVDVKVTNHNGKGTLSELTVFVVDEGVLSLIDYQTPDPFSYFYRERALAVRTTETRHYIIEQLIPDDEKGDVGGGGGEEYSSVQRVRKDFKSSIHWDPSLVTDQSGRASFSFTLPDNLTSFRIMAVAQSKSSEFGKADTRIQVSKSLMLRPALPRFLRPGDQIEAGVVVHNYSDQSGTINLDATAKGLTLTGPSKSTINLAAGAAREVRFQYKVPDGGVAEFLFTGSMAQHSDAVQIKLPVLKPVTTFTVATSGSTLKPGHKEKIKTPENVFPEAGGLFVSVSSTAFSDLEGSFEYLFEYPYGCLEQKISRILPAILFGDVVKAFGFNAFKEGEDLDQMVSNVLSEVHLYQSYSGGFRYWPESGYDSPYVSCYTVLALQKAKEAGYPVRKHVLQKGIKYLQNMVRQDHSTDSGFGLFTWHYIDAFALMVLAETGNFDAPSAELLFSRRDELPYFARAMLLKALKKGNGSQMITDVLQNNLQNSVKVSASVAHFEEPVEQGLSWVFHSNVKTTAIILQTLLEIDGQHPLAGKIVKWLLMERKIGRWRTTQENAFVFWALGTYFRIYEADEPDFKIDVRLKNLKILEDLFDERTTRVSAKDIPMAELPRGQSVDLVFNKKGDGRLYYNARLTYAPVDPQKARDEGIGITKSISDLKGRAVKGNTFSAGETYKITLDVLVPQQRHFVVVNDPLPAGFEAVNSSLATAGLQEKAVSSGTATSWWYSGFNKVQLKDDRVLLFADVLFPGNHSYTYLARATTFGKFEMPVTKSEEMYFPETFGSTASSTIVIK